MIRKVSPKRAKQNAEYEKLKRAWRKNPQNQICSVPGCGRMADRNPHHSLGRGGRLLCFVPAWRAICLSCHRRVSAEPLWARGIGLLAPFGQWNLYPK